MEKKATVYVLTGDLEFISFIKKYLTYDFLLRFDHNEENIIEKLLLSRPDCLIINMEQLSNGLKDMLPTIQQWCEQNFIPIIAIVNRFFHKRINYLSIADAVFYHPVNSVELIASMKKHIKKRLHFLSHSLLDTVTGAFNHLYLQTEFQRHLDDIKRSHESLTIVYLEVGLDRVHFSKKIETLKRFVLFIKNSIRPTDFLGNYLGYHGFIIILPKTGRVDASRLLERLEQQLSSDNGVEFFQHEPVSFSSKVLEVTDPSISPMDWLRKLTVESTEQVQLKTDSIEGEFGRKRINIAIIDDDRLIRELLQHQLQGIGEGEIDLDIKSFADGEEFFNDSWHRQNVRFLLIIDRVMPKMDGLEVLRKVRAQYDRNRYLCLMLTSKGSEADIALAIQQGANDYMTKPFNLKELQVRIMRLIRGQKG